MSSKDDAFLEEARLGPRTRVLVECEEIPNIARLRRRFREYLLTDLAHAVMLAETGIVAPERGARLLEGLLEMHDGGGAGFPWLPDSGSFLVQTEHYLARRVGEDVAGRLQTGRSRNDQSAAAERLYVRDLILDVAGETVLKKNPHSLERVKALAGQAAGWFAGVMACQHGIVSTDLDFTFADDLLTTMGDATLQSLKLSAASVETLTVHSERMADSAGAFWSTTSHLADELVRRYDLPFRAAHHVVGRFVRDSLAAGRTPADVRPEDLTRAGREMAGTPIEIDVAELRRLLDARAFLTSRATAGSVHPSETRAHRARLAGRLEEHRSWQEASKAGADAAIRNLVARAREIARA